MSDQFDKTIEWDKGGRFMKLYAKTSKKGTKYYMGQNNGFCMTAFPKTGFKGEEMLELNFVPIKYTKKGAAPQQPVTPSEAGELMSAGGDEVPF